MNSYFLPVGLLLAFAVAWLNPEPGTVLQRWGLIPWMVVAIFLVNGYQSDLKALPRGRSILMATLVGLLISLVISPFVGLAAVSVLPLPLGAAIGIVVMATVPPTLSSGIVMTGIAGGNVVKALYLTVVLNLVGVFTIPYMLHLTLGSVGLVEISPLPLLRQLVLLVLVPFLLGMLAKRALGLAPAPWVKLLPTLCVIGTVWMSVSASVETLRVLSLELLVMITFGALIVHLTLLLLCWLARFVYRPTNSEWIALLFPVAQKTLPVAIGVLAAMGEPLGLAVVACILFHFLQLFIDSMIASRLGRKTGDTQTTV